MPRPKSNLVQLPEVCEHGNRFRCFRAVIPGSVVYDPGCKDKKTLKMRPHRIPKTGGKDSGTAR